MSNVFTVRDHLLHELEHGVVTTRRLLELVKPEQWDYRPRDNMRTLLEVAHHLVLIPASDLAIMQEKSEEEVQRIEQSLRDERDPSRLGDIMRQNFETYKAYITSLSEDEFLNKATKAFYAEQPAVQVKWMIETVTHTFHHRSQLYSYLKQLGHDIRFFILY